MAIPSRPPFSFRSLGCAEDTFQVVRFAGEEGIGRCYRFELELFAEDRQLDLDALMASPACFTLLRQDGLPGLPFHGLLAEFSRRQRIGSRVHCQAVLVPRLWRLGLTRGYQVHLDRTIPEVLRACLEDGGLTSLDFRFALGREPAAWERWDYLCMYGESHLDFLQRRMEREGLSYFFEQEDGRDRVVITDTPLAHSPRAGDGRIRYRPESGQHGPDGGDRIIEFVSRHTLVPAVLTLRDRHPLDPAVDLTASTEVCAHGHGHRRSFGEHARSPEESRRLARIRAEAARCGAAQFQGCATAPWIQAGYRFTLEDHFLADANGDYLVSTVRHQGSQPGLLPGPPEPRPSGSGAPEPASGATGAHAYLNRFTAIPAQVPFRPARATPAPCIRGVIPATVDAEGEGVQLDRWSRYRIRLPFDESGRGGGKASAWVGMLGPYAGAGHGWNAPLHKGTEVLLAFIGGDPDRPVIAGAVPNPATPSPVNQDNPSQVVLRTAGGNHLAFDDQSGRESVQFSTPAQETRFRLDTPGPDGDGGAQLVTLGWLKQVARENDTKIQGADLLAVDGGCIALDHGSANNWFFFTCLVVKGGALVAEWPWADTVTPDCAEIAAAKEDIKNMKTYVQDRQLKKLGVENLLANRSDSVIARVHQLNGRFGQIGDSQRHMAERIEAMMTVHEMFTCSCQDVTVESLARWEEMLDVTQAAWELHGQLDCQARSRVTHTASGTELPGRVVRVVGDVDQSSKRTCF